MAIELITGVGETNHVSSNDFRAFNRAIFGQQRYILKDADNMDVVVSAVTGDISIATGSCVWSGMHIRIASVENLKYIVPVSTQRINIYLHYTKSIETFVESVEFVVLQGSEASPIVNELDDDTIEAYTLFYSFDATSTAISNINKAFDSVISQSDIVDEVNKSIANATATTVLFEGEAGAGSTIDLSESFKNFKELEISFAGINIVLPIGHARILTQNITERFSVGAVLGMRSTTEALNIGFECKSETKFYVEGGNGVYVTSKSSYTVNVRKIIGIGRVNNG